MHLPPPGRQRRPRLLSPLSWRGLGDSATLLDCRQGVSVWSSLAHAIGRTACGRSAVALPSHLASLLSALDPAQYQARASRYRTNDPGSAPCFILPSIRPPSPRVLRHGGPLSHPSEVLAIPRSHRLSRPLTTLALPENSCSRLGLQKHTAWVQPCVPSLVLLPLCSLRARHMPSWSSIH